MAAERSYCSRRGGEQDFGTGISELRAARYLQVLGSEGGGDEAFGFRLVCLPCWEFPQI